MIALSININKIATLRNARGANLPDVCKAAMDIERFGADGITVHPRPDERHIRYADVYALKKCIKGEFNIEGNPQHAAFIKLVLAVQPQQVTLVPDTTDQLTSNQGWNPIAHADFLKSHIAVFKAAGIRTSLFLDPKPEWVVAAAATTVVVVAVMAAAVTPAPAVVALTAAPVPVVGKTAAMAAVLLPVKALMLAVLAVAAVPVGKPVAAMAVVAATITAAPRVNPLPPRVLP